MSQQSQNKSDSSSDDWDVDKYFDETEPEEHWELRRKFILKNKGKYPENYVVALSRVFTNIEFLGCSYNEDVMKKVTELSEGVVESYREKKKGKLQRTFVKASDAAESKFTGNRQPHSSTIGATQYSAKDDRKDDRNSYPSYSTNERQSSQQSYYSAGEQRSNRGNKFYAERDNKRKSAPNYDTHDSAESDTNKLLLEKARSQQGIRGKLVLIKQHQDMQPYQILNHSINFHPEKIRIEKASKLNPELQFEYNMFIGQELICSCFAPNEKEARQKLAEQALTILQESCFTIERKVPLLSSGETIEKSSTNTKAKNEADMSKTDNIGAKLMKMMGWSGKGLGKEEDGREETVEVKEYIHRNGLGFSATVDDKEVRRQLEKMIMEYANSDKASNLVFSSDFTNPERKFLHSMAAKYNLKSRSYGSEEQGNRQLVISRKIKNWEIVEDLLNAGGSSEQFNLIFPTKLEVSTNTVVANSKNKRWKEN